MTKCIKCGARLHGLDRYKPDTQCVTCDLAEAYKNFLRDKAAYSMEEGNGK